MAELAKKMMVLKTALNMPIYINPDHVEFIKADRKHILVHFRTKGNNWFHVKHTLGEFAEIYMKAKSYNLNKGG